MATDQFENSDNPSRPPDSARPGEPAPDKPTHDPPETSEPDVGPTELRTRQEYADEVRPDLDPQSEMDSTDQSTCERSDRGDILTEVEESEAGHSQRQSSEDEPHSHEHSEWEQPSVPGKSAGETDQPGTSDSSPETPAGPNERNHDKTDAEPGERPTDVDEHGDPSEDDARNYEERGNDVLDRLLKAHAADLATDHANTTDPDNKQWTSERNRIHGEIVSDLYNRASAVPCEYKAIIAGGLPGAGKTTILTEQAGIDLSKYLIINPDDIKEVLASRELIPQIEGLSPMEASDLAHEESSVIAKHLAHQAQAVGKNIIWDITMSRSESTHERIDSLRASGYRQIDAIFVDIPIKVSITRTQARHREGQENWQAGQGMGGRFVPPEVIRKQADPEWGSKNKWNFENIKQSVNNWSVFDNGADGHRAIIVDSSDFHKLDSNPHEKRPQ